MDRFSDRLSKTSRERMPFSTCGLDSSILGSRASGMVDVKLAVWLMFHLIRTNMNTHIFLFTQVHYRWGASLFMPAQHIACIYDSTLYTLPRKRTITFNDPCLPAPVSACKSPKALGS